MSEVFEGTPTIVGVTIVDQEHHQKTYHVAGRDFSDVCETIKSALSGTVPAAFVKKPRKPRAPKESQTPETCTGVKWGEGKTSNSSPSEL